MIYHNRIVDVELTERLSAMGAVLIEGPRACGKTTTGKQFASSEVFMDVDRDAREAVALDPSLVLEGETPRLIDEWQLEPEIWNHVRKQVDERNEPGQFILTGSAVPADDITRHTGAGRISRLKMRPMSLFELGTSSGEASLGELLDGKAPRTNNPEISLTEIVEFCSTGGWPANLNRSTHATLEVVRSYLDEIRRVDIARMDGKTRDPENVSRLFRSLARNVATEATVRTLAKDVGGPEIQEDTSAESLARSTVRDYLNALERLMVVEDQPAWSPHLRSKSRLRKSPKRHFVDPSLAVAALRASPESLLNDLNYVGLLFESLVVRDLRVYAQANDAEVLHYRDNTGLEVDAVVSCADGRWAAFEVKLGRKYVDDAAENLLAFRDRVDTEKSGQPQMLGVIVGNGYGLMRKDGVAEIPIGALGP